jgi:murein DD-endopeptidase MepM/ murein hydrolase activator NlpD
VRRGDVVGLIGSTGRSTGAHLHFEVRVDGRADDPLERIGSAISGAVSAPPVASRWAGWEATTSDRLPSSRIN